MNTLKKHCSNCKEEKKVNQFHNDKRGLFLVESICKICRHKKNRENYHKNIEHYRNYFRKWQNTDKWKEYQHNYYLKNKDRIIENQKKDLLYLEKKNVRWHKRKARLLGNGGNHTVKEWQELCKKWGDTCVKCRKKKKLTKDHIISLNKGGTNDIKNIQPLCQSCNSIKGRN